MGQLAREALPRELLDEVEPLIELQLVHRLVADDFAVGLPDRPELPKDGLDEWSLLALQLEKELRLFEGRRERDQLIDQIFGPLRLNWAAVLVFES